MHLVKFYLDLFLLQLAVANRNRGHGNRFKINGNHGGGGGWKHSGNRLPQHHQQQRIIVVPQSIHNINHGNFNRPGQHNKNPNPPNRFNWGNSVNKPYPNVAHETEEPEDSCLIPSMGDMSKFEMRCILIDVDKDSDCSALGKWITSGTIVMLKCKAPFVSESGESRLWTCEDGVWKGEFKAIRCVIGTEIKEDTIQPKPQESWNPSPMINTGGGSGVWNNLFPDLFQNYEEQTESYKPSLNGGGVRGNNDWSNLSPNVPETPKTEPTNVWNNLFPDEITPPKEESLNNPNLGWNTPKPQNKPEPPIWRPYLEDNGWHTSSTTSTAKPSTTTSWKPWATTTIRPFFSTTIGTFPTDPTTVKPSLFPSTIVTYPTAPTTVKPSLLPSTTVTFPTAPTTVKPSPSTIKTFPTTTPPPQPTTSSLATTTSKPDYFNWNKDDGPKCPPLMKRQGVQIKCISKVALPWAPSSFVVTEDECETPQPVGSEATYTCHKYYEATASLKTLYRKCKEDGTWTGGSDIFSCALECGVANPLGQIPLIVNGEPTYKSQWPWHAALFFRHSPSNSRNSSDNQFVYNCGATLITKRVLLSAAHCIVKDNSGTAKDPSGFRVDLGRYDRTVDDEFVQTIYAEQVFVHPDYNPLSYDSDIAIIILKEDVSIGYHVRPICYPQWQNTAFEEVHLASGSIGTVVGFGKNENDVEATILHMARLRVVSSKECSLGFADTTFGSTLAKSTTFCAGWNNGTNACSGDSGGGIYFSTTTLGSSRWYLLGLVSVGVQKQDGSKRCDPERYSVFTKISPYADWIGRTLSEHAPYFN